MADKRRMDAGARESSRVAARRKKADRRDRVEAKRDIRALRVARIGLGSSATVNAAKARIKRRGLTIERERG